MRQRVALGRIRFFGSMKTELDDASVFDTRQAAKNAVFSFAERFYNGQRLHWAIAYRPPDRMQQLAAAAQAVTGSTVAGGGVKVPKEALKRSRSRRHILPFGCVGLGGFRVKAITDVFGVSRSDVIEHVTACVPQDRHGDDKATGEIRGFIERRTNYVTLLVNAKRVYRLKKKQGSLLEGDSGPRRPREHDGPVVATRSVVRITFLLDCHERMVIGWVVTTAGISDGMIRDLMIGCAGKRFNAVCASEVVRWLTADGPIYGADNTHSMPIALDLVACFTPVQNRESNGTGDTFVKTFKRDYVRINPVPVTLTSLAIIENWIVDGNGTFPYNDLALQLHF